MKKLVEIVIRWSIHKISFHTDIKDINQDINIWYEVKWKPIGKETT